MLAALFLAPLLGLAHPPPAPPTAGETADGRRLNACIEKIDQKPDEAYEDAMRWVNESHVREARMCQALALIGLKQVDKGALILEKLAQTADGASNDQRAVGYSQAGNARLIALEGEAAIRDFDNALHFVPGAADVLIDRARAWALLAQYQKAEDDLTHALDARPRDVLALSLRAEARLHQNVLDLAERDAEEAVRLAPDDVEALLVRGRVREARAGRPPA